MVWTSGFSRMMGMLSYANRLPRLVTLAARASVITNELRGPFNPLEA